MRKEEKLLWNNCPEIARLLKYPERGYELTYGSAKEEIFICPNCEYEKSYKIYDIVARNFSCPRCGDGISYPNKLAFALLEQLNVEFIFEYNPDWIKPKRYDFYFELNNAKYILEMDGIFHKNDKKTIETDKFKNKIARKNDITIIRINCDISDLEFIATQILNSKLSVLFNLNNIDWVKCHNSAINSSLVKMACNYWNDIENTQIIANIMKLSKCTVIKYLKRGVKLGWCNYNPKEEMKKSGMLSVKRRNKPVVQLTLNGKPIKIWNSIKEAGNTLGISCSHIAMCCKKVYRYKSAGGFQWLYKCEYDQNKELEYVYRDRRGKYNKRQIVQLNLNHKLLKQWNSIIEAERTLNISNIGYCCQGKYNTAGGFKWMYLKDYKQYINNSKEVIPT
ncbi:MAG: NUMOD1 domain-containing DNA-binding protein [Candidatus Aenigmarchaeota archaeon]|nr:NUMOD1 domain-containing DNA-binding protein [Candidatus Aenigmarchaeota archaeon]